MLNIKCPNCGFRDEIEFACGGEGHITRPNFNNELTNKEWSEYLFSRYNPKGYFIERWVHISGCRKWFNIVRCTITNEIFEVYPIGLYPKSNEGKLAFANNWRRNTKAEVIASGKHNDKK